MSKVAYTIGYCLDPDACQCPPDSTNCPLCGVPPGGGHDVYGVPHPRGLHGGYSAPHPTPLTPGVHGDPNYHSYGDGSEGMPPYAGPRAPHPPRSGGPPHGDLIHSSPSLDAISEELGNRNAELIQARADLSRVQSQVQDVRRDMTAWQEEMQRFQQQLEVRDRQRRAALDEVTGSVARLVEDSAQ